MGNCRSHSRGCRTCVKRRVKCDERHPSCSRCEKAGFNCGGFREATFVDARQQVMRRFVSHSKAWPASSTTVIPSSKTISRQRHAIVDTKPFQTRYWPVLQSMRLPHDIPRSPHTSSLLDEVYVSYIVKNLFRGPMALIYRNVLFCKPSDMRPHHLMMNECLLAMAKVFYGVQHRNNRVIQDGLRLYGRGISMLSDFLSKADCSVTTEMIVSVFSLCVGESIMPTTKSSWMVHILGLERLFALQGPLINGNDAMINRVLLNSCRPLMIIAAFFTRRPSLMGEPEWKTTTQLQSSGEIPLLGQTLGAVSDLSFLMETLAVLPALFLQCDECIKLAKTTLSPHPLVAMLWSRTKHLQQELQAWKKKWDKDHQDEVYEIVPMIQIDSAQAMPWTTVFHFTTVELANTFTMYQAVNILLTGIPTSLLKVGLGNAFPTSNLLDCDGIGVKQSMPNVATSIQNICRSLEYYLQALHPSQAPADFYLFFPVHVARRASKQLEYVSEHSWLEEAVKVMESQFPTGLWVKTDFDNKFCGSQDGLFD